MNKKSTKKSKISFSKVAEKDIQSSILSYLTLAGYTAVRVPLGPRLVSVGKKQVWTKNPLAGFPDIMGWLDDGTPFYIEVKSEKGRLSDKQKQWKAFFESRPNCIYIVARSVAGVIDELKKAQPCSA